ncbi:hypothetical protein V2J09_003734 [Rumex salicifolius]
MEALGHYGGISILWDESYTSVTIMSKQDHFIRFKSIKGKCVFQLISLYALLSECVFRFLSLIPHNLSVMIIRCLMSWLMKFVRKLNSQIESEWKLSVPLASYTSVTIMSKQDHFIRFKAIKGKCVFQFIFLYALLSECVFRFVSLMPHNLSVMIIKMLDINGDESLAITANAN